MGQRLFNWIGILLLGGFFLWVLGYIAFDLLRYSGD